MPNEAVAVRSIPRQRNSIAKTTSYSHDFNAFSHNRYGATHHVTADTCDCGYGPSRT